MGIGSLRADAENNCYPLKYPPGSGSDRPPQRGSTRPRVAWYLQSREWADTPSERRDSAKRCFKHPEQQPQKVNLFRKLVWLRPDDAGVQRATLTQGHVQPPRPAPSYLRPLRPLPSLASWVHKRGRKAFPGTLCVHLPTGSLSRKRHRSRLGVGARRSSSLSSTKRG